MKHFVKRRKKRMRTLAFLLLSVVNLIHSQDMQQMIVFTLQGILEKLENVSEKLKGYETIQQKQDEIMDKLMDVQQKIGNLETNVQELSRDTEQCLRGEDLEHLTNVSAEANHEIKSFHEDMSGIISLAEKDECSEGSNPCGARGTCHNSIFSFSCSCPSGFTWDGSDCADINECAEGKGVCSPNAVCNNSIGSYSCSCNKPFEGDGRTSCEIQCRSPARFMKDLGCLKYVRSEDPFDYQNDICKSEGGRMLQKFEVHHITDISKTYAYRGDQEEDGLVSTKGNGRVTNLSSQKTFGWKDHTDQTLSYFVGSWSGTILLLILKWFNVIVHTGNMFGVSSRCPENEWSTSLYQSFYNTAPRNIYQISSNLLKHNHQQSSSNVV
ncbi:uncharacterized protein [Palaemon carinicauda]|uniref:uncharacterized protein n=1 Tax=Palaemon carinicauda TaxID=392227 RepID=UPI0035B5A6D3